MKVEISALFGMDYSGNMVNDSYVGDGVHLQEIKLNEQIEEHFRKVKESNADDHRALVVGSVAKTFRPYKILRQQQALQHNELRREYFLQHYPLNIVFVFCS